MLLIMGNAGFISSTVGHWLPSLELGFRGFRILGLRVSGLGLRVKSQINPTQKEVLDDPSNPETPKPLN